MVVYLPSAWKAQRSIPHPKKKETNSKICILGGAKKPYTASRYLWLVGDSLFLCNRKLRVNTVCRITQLEPLCSYSILVVLLKLSLLFLGTGIVFLYPQEPDLYVYCMEKSIMTTHWVTICPLQHFYFPHLARENSGVIYVEQLWDRCLESTTLNYLI